MSKAVRLGLAMALGLIASCAPQEDTTHDEFPSFVREPSDRPVIDAGTAGWPSLVADPSVIADEEGYHLFFSVLACRRPDGSYDSSWDPERKEGCDLNGAVGTTAYAFSRDRGLTWEFRATPVVLPGAEAWNGGDVETPFVCRVADRLYLFYCALGRRDDPTFRYRFQLGVATLDLGGRTIREALLHTAETFTHRKEAVVPADLVERHGINYSQEPSVVVKDGRLELYFVSLGLSKPEGDMTTAGQEVSVALRRTVLDPSLQEIEPPSAPLLTGAAANIPEVRYFDGRYHLFTTRTELDDHEADEITHSTSSDGLHFTAPETILRRRSGDVFDNWGLMAPTLVVEPAAVVLFHTAWEMQEHRCQISGVNGRMGMKQESRPELARCLYGTLGRAIAKRTPAE